MNLDESYRALGLKPGASLEEVRGAYHRLVKLFHPDRRHGSAALLQKATEETKRLNVAYERVCKVFGGRRAAGGKREASEVCASAGGRFGAGSGEGVCCSVVRDEVELGCGRTFLDGEPRERSGAVGG